MWCVCVCDALSQQYLEEEAVYGQADCSITSGTRKLHVPASHWALALLPDTDLGSEGSNTQISKETLQFTIAWCTDHVV